LGKTVDELLGSLDAVDIAEWMAFDRIEPFGEERADLRMAIVACTIANANRGKGQKAFKVDDFMPKFEPRKKQTVTQMGRMLGLIAAANKKKV
jgi:hypothetical protein